jgi:hypothetical protein
LHERASMLRYTYIACLVLVWPLLPTRCRCRGLLLHLITLNDTHTHSIGHPWTWGRPVTEISTYTPHNNHKRQTSMPPAGFEPEIPASERPQTYALNRAATVIGTVLITKYACRSNLWYDQNTWLPYSGIYCSQHSWYT